MDNFKYKVSSSITPAMMSLSPKSGLLTRMEKLPHLQLELMSMYLIMLPLHPALIRQLCRNLTIRSISKIPNRSLNTSWIFLKLDLQGCSKPSLKSYTIGKNALIFSINCLMTSSITLTLRWGLL